MVHWKQKELNVLQQDSCIRFIGKYRDYISQKNYSDYHRGMYYLTALNGGSKYVNYYARESYKYVREVSFNDFIFVHGKNRKYKVMLFLKFAFLHIVYFFGINC